MDYSQTRIIQWNCQSLRNKKAEVMKLIHKYNPSILAVAETWLKPLSPYSLRGFSCVRDDRQDGRAGSALFVSSTIPFSILSLPVHNNNINVVGISVNNISIVSLYISSPDHHSLLYLKNLFETLHSPFIILGDFNYHHSLWGSSTCDTYGNKLVQFFHDYNLIVLNDGRPTRLTSPIQNPSAVDLTICSNNISSLLSWDIESLSHGSDHYPIIINSPIKNSNNVLPPLLKYNIKNVTPDGWNNFGNLLNEKIKMLPVISDHNFLNCYNDFISNLIIVADSSFRIKNPKKYNKKSPPWWDDECSDFIKKRKTAELKYKHNMTMENFIEFKHILAKSRRVFKKKKFNSWRKFCCSLSPETPSAQVWQNIRCFRSSQNCNNSISPVYSSWTDSFFHKIAPDYVPCLSECNNPINFSFSSHHHHFDSPFTLKELKIILSSVKDSAPGIDGIPYSFLVNSMDFTLEYILKIYNFIFNTGVIPQDWKTQLVIPILKPGKDPSSHLSFRPIALSSILSKLFEHLIKNRLEYYVENRNILSQYQLGFRKGKSAIDNLSIFFTDVRLAFSRNESLCSVFLDIEAAYDNVLLNILYQKLINIGVSSKFTSIICCLLCERNVKLRVLDQPENLMRKIWKGLPQGSVLSPLLFNIYTYDLGRQVNSWVRFLQYADDLVLYTNSKNIKNCEVNLNKSLYQLNSWLCDIGLSLSPMKSNVVVFSRKKICPIIEIKINNIILDLKNQVKFLGVILDSKLNGVNHINHILTKCEKNLNIMRVLSGTWWGSHPFSQRLLYNAIIRSHFDYASFLIEPCNKTSLKKIDDIQSKALRIIIGAMKSSPINALQVECADAPLKKRRQYLCDKYFFKAVQFSNHPLLPKLKLLSQYIFSNRTTKNFWKNKKVLPRLIYSFSKLKNIKTTYIANSTLPVFANSYESLIHEPRVILDLGIIKNDSINSNEIFYNTLKYYWPNDDYFFTDASKLSPQGSVGWSIFHENSKVSFMFKSPSQASVFSGECLAIKYCISFILENEISHSLIFSDSLSSLQSVLSNPFSPKNRSEIVFDIKNLLHQCHINNLTVTLVYIPSHCGIFGNENADHLAKQAVVHGKLNYFKNYSYDLVSQAKIYLQNSWNNYWKQSAKFKGSYLFSLQPEVSLRPWFSKFKNFNKTTTSIVSRLRIGHSCLPTHLFKLKIVNNNLCECGDHVGDIDHVFFNCKNHNPSLYSFLHMYNVALPTRMNILLRLSSFEILSLICKYINHHNIKL